MEKESWSYEIIGDKNYVLYKSLMGIIVPCILFGTAIGWLGEMIQNPDVYWYMGIGIWIARAITDIVVAYILMLILFSILAKKDIQLNIFLGKESGVKVGEKAKQGFKRAGIFGSILCSLFFTSVFIFVPEIFCGIFDDGREIIPVFNSDFIKQSVAIILLMWGIEFVTQVGRFIYLRYNTVVVCMTIIGNVMIAFLTFSWLRSGELINSALINKILEVCNIQDPWFVDIVANSQNILLVIIFFGLGVEVIEAVIKTMRR